VTKSAFPHLQPLNQYTEHGMTLRDWFAGQALMGLLAGRSDGVSFTPEAAAASAHFVADAMMAEREKSK
jgi:hypothetical protein